MKHEAANNLILDYIYGELATDTLRRFQRHVDSCEECRSELDGLKAAQSAVSFLKGEVVPSSGVDRAIIAQARMAAVRQRGKTLEAEQARRFRFKSLFNPAAIASVAVVFVIFMAVFYLPGQKSPDKTALNMQNDIAETAPTSADAASAPKTRGKAAKIKSLGYETGSDTAPETPRNAESAAAGETLKDQDELEERSIDGVKVVKNEPKVKKELDRKMAAPASQPSPPAATPPAGPEPKAPQRAVARPIPPTPNERRDAPPVISGEGSAVNEAVADNAAPVEEEDNLAEPRKTSRKRKSSPAPAPAAAPEREPTGGAGPSMEKKPPAEAPEKLYKEAKKLEKRGKYDEAAKKYSKLLANYPDFRRQEVLYRLGKVYSKQRKNAKATQYYDQLKKEYPNQKLLGEKEYRKARGAE